MPRRVRVYVACSLTYATDEYKAMVEHFKQQLGRFCEVLCFMSVMGKPPLDIFVHDIFNCVGKSDLLVAIGNVAGQIQTGSDGRGSEMTYQLMTRHKPVLLLMQEGSTFSPYSLGMMEYHPALAAVHRYQHLDDMVGLVQQKVAEIAGELNLEHVAA